MDKCQPASIITSSTVHEIIAAGYGMGVSEAERKRFNLREADLASDDIAYIDELSLAGQSLMVMRHGSLYPTCTPGIIAHNGYNNGDHTRNFAQDVRTLGRHLDHTLAQVSVHQLIAHWHDIDQTTAIFGLPRLGRDEKVS